MSRAASGAKSGGRKASSRPARSTGCRPERLVAHHGSNRDDMHALDLREPGLGNSHTQTRVSPSHCENSRSTRIHLKSLSVVSDHPARNDDGAPDEHVHHSHGFADQSRCAAPRRATRPSGKGRRHDDRQHDQRHLDVEDRLRKRTDRARRMISSAPDTSSSATKIQIAGTRSAAQTVQRLGDRTLCPQASTPTPVPARTPTPGRRYAPSGCRQSLPCVL